MNEEPHENPPAALFEAISRLSAEFLSRAEETDQQGPGNALLEENVRRLARAGFYGAGISPVYGGAGLSEEQRRECTKIISAACGVTAFTQQQLHSGGGFVGGSRDESLKRELLPKFASGEILCGVAFSHLRRPGPPAVRARKVDGGFVVDGEAPWVTGWRFLDSFILGATCEDDGRLCYFYVPIAPAGAALNASPPLRLAAMDASDTVKVEVRGLFCEERSLLFTRAVEEMRRGDYCGITGHVWLPLGCAQGSAALLRSIGAERNRQNILEAAGEIEAEIDAVQEQALYWNASRADDPGYRAGALGARARAIDLAVRAAGAAVAAMGGRAHLLTNPAQRRWREAAFYATIAQTPDVQTALLETWRHG